MNNAIRKLLFGESEKAPTTLEAAEQALTKCEAELAKDVAELAEREQRIEFILSQLALAHRLKMERTSALRMFKAATGLTFRRFKQWSALQHAAHLIGEDQLKAALPLREVAHTADGRVYELDDK